MTQPKNFRLMTGLTIALIWLSPAVLAQEAPVIKALHTDQSIEIDGKLTEKVWQGEGYPYLIQLEPREGAAPTERTRVYIAYDAEGLYVAGICYHTGADSIAGGIGRRDEEIESDWFWFWIDPNRDFQNGFGFAVNPDGSIIDQKLYQDIYSDNDWDGLWQAAAVKKQDRWTFEMAIPFSQLRFSRQAEYVWGVNFMRYILSNAEENYFALVPKEENGFVSRFGTLRGLQDITPPARLFITPYTMGKVVYDPDISGSAFTAKRKYHRNLGVDIKYGLTGNLTLDLAINPDFGQAEVDPAQINLSAFETYYQEKRAFFMEGSDIFQFGANPAGGTWGCYWYSPDIFYSRRIGRAPSGINLTGGETYTPEQTTILGAAKVSGKVDKWSLGSISALTEREYALVKSSGSQSKKAIEPLSYYGVYRGLREFNQGDQGLGFMVTQVNRDNHTAYLDQRNNRQAYVGGLDGWHFFGDNRDYAFMGHAAWSMVAGSRARILNLQQSSTHYFQRPDFQSAELDSNRNQLSGFMGRFGFKKMRGQFTGQAALGIISPGFNTNDLGFSSRNNVYNMHVVGGYRWLVPSNWYHRIGFNLMTSRNYDFDGNLLFRQFYGSGYWVMPTYHVISASLQLTPAGLDLYATRGGPIMAYPGYLNGSVNFQTDSRQVIQITTGFSGQSVTDGGYYYRFNLGLVGRPSPSLRLSISANRTWAEDHHQWVYNQMDAATPFGYHHIFASILQDQLSATFRIDWGVTPTLSIQGYFQPFIAVGDYHHFKELTEAQTYNYAPYDFILFDPDFNFKSFRANLVIRWEYLPGSILYLVWTQDRDNYSHPGNFGLRRDMGDLLHSESTDIFFLKASYTFQK